VEDIWTQREKVTGDWRKLHNEELHDLYLLRDIIQVIKFWRMSWAGHVACVEEKWVQGFSWET
jgi:hypothetical protein